MTDVTDVAAEVVVSMIRAGVIPNTRATLARIEQTTTIDQQALAAAKGRLIRRNWALDLGQGPAATVDPDPLALAGQPPVDQPAPAPVVECPPVSPDEYDWAVRPPEVAPWRCSHCARAFHVRRHFEGHLKAQETAA